MSTSTPSAAPVRDAKWMPLTLRFRHVNDLPAILTANPPLLKLSWSLVQV